MRKHLKLQIFFTLVIAVLCNKSRSTHPNRRVAARREKRGFVTTWVVRWREDGRLRRIDLGLDLRSIIDGIHALVACHTFSLAASAAASAGCGRGTVRTTERI